ncbi:MAG: TIGR00730 family Rossman fold protein [Chlamydiales bacterium]|nr:TIGR00730 family Rossman fold protein [Chlamydiales bacterium]
MSKIPLPEEVPHIFAKDAWRVFRIISEFVDGFETMTNLGPSVSIFGSARLPPDNPYYQMGIEVAQQVSQRGFAIITGGGPGLMEAANKGAQSMKGASCGLAIDLPFEESSNAFIDPRYRLQFRYFFVRKVMFIRYAQGFVFLPGGFGTMDELFEALTLIQTNKIRKFPIYLMGTSYWAGLFDWIRNTVVKMGCIYEEDLHLLRFTDDPKEVADGIELHYRSDQTDLNF